MQKLNTSTKAGQESKSDDLFKFQVSGLSNPSVHLKTRKCVWIKYHKGESLGIKTTTVTQAKRQGP